MTDLTKITTPFGLLDETTKAALMAHGGPYEWWAGRDWADAERLPWNWHPSHTYRARPAPPKPRDFWAVGKHLHDTPEEAEAFRARVAEAAGPHHLDTPIIQVREVL